MPFITVKKEFICKHCAKGDARHKALGYCENCYRQLQYWRSKGPVDKFTLDNKIKA